MEKKFIALKLLVRPGKDVTKVAVVVAEEDMVSVIDRFPTEIAIEVKKWRNKVMSHFQNSFTTAR
jgi:hypothetical protein